MAFKRHGDRCSSGLAVPDRDVASVRLDDRLRDREPQPRMFPGLVLGKEGQEHAAEQFRRNSRASVLDRQADGGSVVMLIDHFVFKGANGEASAVRHRLDRIVQHVNDGLFDARPVQEQRRQAIREIQRHRDAASLQFRLQLA